jgi:hypothetical protein
LSRFSGSLLLVPTASLVLGLAVCLRPLGSPDLLWQIRAGEQILAGGARVDAASAFFRGAPLRDHETAFEAIVATLYAHGGMVSLWWLDFALTMLFIAAAIASARTLVPSRTARVLGAAVLVAAVGARLDLRPEIAIYVAIAAAHALRCRARADAPYGVARFAPIVVGALAAPFHALSVLVVVVPLAHATAEALFARRFTRVAVVDLFVAAGTAVALVLVGSRPFSYVLSERTSPFGAHIVERYGLLHAYRRTHDLRPALALVAAVVALAGLLVVARRTKDARPLAAAITMAVLLVPGFLYVRFAALAPLAMLPSAVTGVATLVAPLVARAPSVLRAGAAVVGCALAFLSGTGELGQHARIVAFDFSHQPVEAVEWLKTHLPDARLFHAYNEGAYLLFERFPARGVVVDPRAAMLYPDDYAAAYYAAVDDPDAFERWADAAPFDTVLLGDGHRTTAALRRYLYDSPRWTPVYDDGAFVVFMRS